MINSQTSQVLVIDDFHPVFIESLESHGMKVDYQADFSVQDGLNRLQNCDILVLRSKLVLDKQTLLSLPKLKCIARGGAGMDNIDETTAKELGITLLNAPEGNRDAVAEHALGLLIGLSKNIVKSHNEVSNFKWEREGNRGWEISGKTIGLIGYGNTGMAFARKLSGFNVHVVAYDKYKTIEQDAYASACSLDELIKQSDIISLHIPLTTETNGMIDSAFIAQMKNELVLINTSRGGICQTKAIWNGIKSGKIKSFATDVLENENLALWDEKDKAELSEMMASNRVIVTPHVAGWTTESYKKIAEVLSQKIIEYTTKVKNN